MTSTPPDAPTHRPRPTGTAGQLLLLAGGKLIALALLLPMSWMGGRSYSALGDQQVDEYHRDFTSLWFNGLPWITLALVVFVGLAATVPSRVTLAAQFAGGALVIASLVLAYAATSGLEDVGGGFGPAVYLVVAGHVVMLVGCVVGPWRRDGYRSDDDGDDDSAGHGGNATALADAIASL